MEIDRWTFGKGKPTSGAYVRYWNLNKPCWLN